MTKQIMLPLLNEVTDLNSCVDYYHLLHLPLLYLINDDDFGNGDPSYYYHEGLLLIKTNNRDDGIEHMEQSFARTAKWMKEGKCGLTQQEFEEECERGKKFRLQQIGLRDKMQKDPESNAKVTAELERRKTANIEILRSYGLSI